MLPRSLRMGVSLVALGVPIVTSGGPPPLALRIESLSRRPLFVHVTSKPPGLWPDPGSVLRPQEEVVLRTPAVVNVADSVHTLRVTVQGSGAVRIHFEGGALAPWGRDITLRRVDGHFQPVWSVHPLP
jgi:hypothetical protein